MKTLNELPALTLDDFAAELDRTPGMPPHLVHFVRSGGFAALTGLLNVVPAPSLPEFEPGQIDDERLRRQPPSPDVSSYVALCFLTVRATPREFWERVHEGFRESMYTEASMDSDPSALLAAARALLVLLSAGDDRMTDTATQQQEAKDELLETCTAFADALHRHTGRDSAGNRQAFGETFSFDALAGLMTRALAVCEDEYRVTIEPVRYSEASTKHRLFNAHRFVALKDLLIEVRRDIESWPVQRQQTRQTRSRHRAFAEALRDLLDGLGVPNRALAIRTSRAVLEKLYPGEPVSDDPLR